MQRGHPVPGAGQQLAPAPLLADQVLQHLEMTLLSSQVDRGHARLVQDSIGAKKENWFIAELRFLACIGSNHG